MTFRRLLPVVATALVAFVAACGASPGTGGASPTSASSPSASAVAQTPSPTASAIAQPSASPSTAPASAYLDDRSNVFANTTDVQVELGTVGGSAGAGQLYWSVPAAVFSTTTAGAQSFVGCYTAHLARPELQAAPPFKPLSIQAGQLSAVATAAAARAALSTACGTANATPLPWGTSAGRIDAANYVDDRSAGEAVIRSYYNALNRKEYTRAYGYWESGASQLPAFTPFQAGYANTKSVTLLTKPGTIGAGAGQTYYSVPAVITASNTDGTTTIFAGCYTLHLGSPNAQATPPFQPVAIQSARIAQAANGSNPSDLLNSTCL